jgi:hypothetical protein
VSFITLKKHIQLVKVWMNVKEVDDTIISQAICEKFCQNLQIRRDVRAIK